MAQISEGGKKFHGHVIFFQTLGPPCPKKKCSTYARVASPAQWCQRQYETFIKMPKKTPGQPGGGSPGEGYLWCIQSLEPILSRLLESVAPASENNSLWEQVGQAESFGKSGKTWKLKKKLQKV